MTVPPGPPGPPHPPDPRSSPVVLRAATVLSPDERWSPGHVAIADGVITAAGPGLGPDAGPSGRVIDLGDRTLVPGFVDVHVHGAASAQLNGDDPDSIAGAVATIAATHARFGTTAMVPTTVSDDELRLVAALRGVAAARGPAGPRARVLGTHLEGPWLAAAKAGAQDPRRLRPPTLSELDRLLAAADGGLRMITMAPELPGALDVVAAAAANGVVVSVGHTAADAATTQRAVDAGARHATHLFNAMPPLLHRAPGPVGVALADPRVSVEVIADGHHLDPYVLRLVAAAAPGRMIAVTDAMAATGMAPGRYRLGDLDVTVERGQVRLADRPETLAGSVLTMDGAVRTLVAAGVSLPAAVTAATRSPADVLGEGALGRFAPGAAADLVVLDGDLHVLATVVAGRAVVDPTVLLDALT